MLLIRYESKVLLPRTRYKYWISAAKGTYGQFLASIAANIATFFHINKSCVV